MKTITLAILFTLINSIIYAQDRLVKKDKTEFKIKVVEITDSEIKYKKFDNLNGPLYNIKKNEVAVIVYENGKVETFDEVKPEAKKVVPASATPQTEATKNNGTVGPEKPVNIENSFIIRKVTINGKEKTAREGFTTHTINVNAPLSGFPAIFNSINMAIVPDILAGLGFSFYSDNSTASATSTGFSIAARGLYSFNNLLKMPIAKYNFYGGLSLNFSSVSTTVTIPGFGTTSGSSSAFGVGLIAGGRITLTGAIGAITEFSFANGGTGVNVGLSFSTRRLMLKALKEKNSN